MCEQIRTLSQDKEETGVSKLSTGRGQPSWQRALHGLGGNAKGVAAFSTTTSLFVGSGAEEDEEEEAAEQREQMIHAASAELRGPWWGMAWALQREGEGEREGGRKGGRGGEEGDHPTVF